MLGETPAERENAVPELLALLVVHELMRETLLEHAEISIERNPDAARNIVRKTGQTGVPVIKIGSKWIVGFDRERIEKELARRAS